MTVHDSGAQLDISNGGGFRWANRSTVDMLSQIPGVVPSLIRCCVDNKLVSPDHHDFAPRIGFAWRPFATDRFVARGGYGIFYDLQNQWYSLTTYDNISTYIGAASYPLSSGTTPQAPVLLDQLWIPGSDFSFFTLPYYRPAPQINWPRNTAPTISNGLWVRNTL